MLARRNGTGRLLPRLLQVGALEAAEQNALGGGRQGEGRHTRRIAGDQFGLALVPLGERRVVWCTADQAGMSDGGEAHLRDMARRGIDPLAVPNGFPGLREQVSEESAAVGGLEDAGVTPLIALEWPDVENVHDQDVAGLS